MRIDERGGRVGGRGVKYPSLGGGGGGQVHVYASCPSCIYVYFNGILLRPSLVVKLPLVI